MTVVPSGRPHDVDGELAERVRNLLDEESRLVKVSDHPFTQFVLGTTPWAGGVGALLAKNAQRRQEIRLQEFLVSLVREIQDRFSELGTRISEEEFATDRFVAQLSDVSEMIARTDDEPKVQFLREYLISGALPNQPDATRRSLLRAYVNTLTGAHLLVLASLYRVQRDLPLVERLGRVSLPGRLPLDATYVVAETGLAADIVPLILQDLESQGLVVDWHDLGNDARARTEYSMSQSGHELVRYLSQEW